MDNLASMLGTILKDGTEAMVIYTDPDTQQVAISFYPEAVDVVKVIGMIETAKYLVLDAVRWEDSNND